MAQPYVAFTALLYLLDVALSILPAEQKSADFPRAFAPWDREERDLVCAFLEHGLTITEMAEILKRTPEAIRKAFENGKIPKSLTRYPRTSIQLCQQDVELLIELTESSERDPLLWVYGQALPSEFWAAAAAPTFRVIRVAPDPLTAQWRPGPESPRHWEAFRHDASAAAQAVWIDLAAQVTQVGGTVLVPPPDPHHKQVSQVREALRRISRKPAPRGSIRIFDEKFRPSPDKLRAPTLLLSLNKWKPSDTAKLPYKTVIAVLPDLSSRTLYLT